MNVDRINSIKPRLRGVIHLVAFFVSLVTGPILVALAQAARLGTGLFTVAVTALFGVSALYHKPNWRPEIRKWLAKLDHIMIFFLISATFTPFALLLGTTWAKIVLIVVWSATLLGVLIQLLPLKLPKRVAVIPYLALGWLGLSLIPDIVSETGVGVPILMLAGGILYTLGAVAYARRSPNPKPGVFGYHEVFHTLVVAAAYCHYAAVALAVS